MTLSETFYQAGQRLAHHEHESPYYCFVITGGYFEARPGQGYECAPCSLLFHPAGEAHANTFGSVPTRCFNIQVPASASRPPVPHSPLHIVAGQPVITAARMYREYRRRDEVSALILEGLALELAGECFRNHQSQQTLRPDWARRCWDLLHDRFLEPLTLSAVAADLDVHPAHLARTFRRAYGCSVGELLRKLRVEWAATAIAGTERPIASIASETGFSDQSHFTRVFKKLAGVTPGQYRAQVYKR